MRREKKLRDTQLKQENKLRKKQRAKEQKEEQKIVKKIAREMEVEEQRVADRKVVERQTMLRVMEQNMKERLAHEEKKAKEHEEDVLRMREYNRLLDEQEAQRFAELNARVTKQKEIADRMEQTVIKAQKAKGDDEALRYMRQQMEADAKSEEKQLRAAAEKASWERATQQFLREQMEEKREKKRLAGEQKRLQFKQLEQETKAFQEEERAKREERRQKFIRNHRDLDEQIRRKAQDKRADRLCMSRIEVMLNRPLLDAVDLKLSEPAA